MLGEAGGGVVPGGFELVKCDGVLVGEVVVPGGNAALYVRIVNVHESCDAAMELAADSLERVVVGHRRESLLGFREESVVDGLEVLLRLCPVGLELLQLGKVF